MRNATDNPAARRHKEFLAEVESLIAKEVDKIGLAVKPGEGERRARAAANALIESWSRVKRPKLSDMFTVLKHKTSAKAWVAKHKPKT